MTEFQARFEAYGGDYESTMQKFIGDEGFYLRMLRMLSEDTCVARLDAALQAGDLSAAFDAAHELKGVSGNLCLTPLYDAVCAIVEPLRAREPRNYAPLFQTVCQSFRDALAILPEEG